MVAIPGVNPFVMWGVFILFVIFLLFLDLWVFHRKDKDVKIKEALIWTGVWFGLAMLFNLFILLEFGTQPALEYLTGYLIEKSLSVDNLFVMLMIFASFQIAHKLQHKILFWGILGAIIMRGALILAGSALVQKFDWILYVFGAFLIYSGISLFFKEEKEFDPHDTWIVRWTRKVVHVIRDHDGKFFKKDEHGKRGVTILFITLLVIEFMDLVFAFDSVPAIFGITTDPFLIFTSNIFAILGLRSLYFVLAHAHASFSYLSIGLSVILVFIGLKMLAAHLFHINVLFSLGFVLFVLIVSILASLYFPHKERRRA